LELLTDPSVLLLDEATSGLDSKSAEDICYLLQSLAGPDRCAVCSIHQPSYQIFMTCFDRVVFLVAGQVAYEGTPNRLAGFFYSLGFEAPSYGNPADFYLKVKRGRAAEKDEGGGRRDRLLPFQIIFVPLAKAILTPTPIPCPGPARVS
jgi:ABC-type multidrug transport system ATPase subunit